MLFLFMLFLFMLFLFMYSGVTSGIGTSIAEDICVV
jgi:hypothetical protein